MSKLNLEKFDKHVLTGLMLVGFGLAGQFYAAWSIDFAFLTAVKDKSCVDIPVYGACIELGAWWNAHFFLLFPIAAISMICGAYLIGRAISNIVPKKNKHGSSKRKTKTN